MLSLAIVGCAAVIYHPLGIQVDTLAQTALPVGIALGKIGLVVVILGFFAATFGAATGTGPPSGYTAAQYFGWQWGKRVALRQARPPAGCGSPPCSVVNKCPANGSAGGWDGSWPRLPAGRTRCKTHRHYGSPCAWLPTSAPRSP